MRLILTGAIACALGAGTAHAAPKMCIPETFGAHRDGVRDDGAALQKALDACSGGGEVRLSPASTSSRRWSYAPVRP